MQYVFNFRNCLVDEYSAFQAGRAEAKPTDPHLYVHRMHGYRHGTEPPNPRGHDGHGLPQVLYGLDCDELHYIPDPADVRGDNYPAETFQVLKANEQRQCGEYHTHRLVLEAWDRLHAGRPTGECQPC